MEGVCQLIIINYLLILNLVNDWYLLIIVVTHLIGTVSGSLIAALYFII